MLTVFFLSVKLGQNVSERSPVEASLGSSLEGEHSSSAESP